MSSGFVTEAEVEEQKRIRQEEWEKVRKPDEPEEAPEQPYDHRSLFDRLEEQKQKKQMEYEEAHKLKNMIKGLDDDEVEFLDFVDRKKMEVEHLKELEEKHELMEFRKNVEKLRESTLEERIKAEIRPVKSTTSSSTSTRSQQKLLKGVVIKRKADDSVQNPILNGTSEAKRVRATSPQSDKKESENNMRQSPQNGKRRREEEAADEAEGNITSCTCVRILPGLGHYGHSSDSDSDSSISDEPEHLRPKYDLCGRRLTYESKDPTKSGRQ